MLYFYDKEGGFRMLNFGEILGHEQVKHHFYQAMESGRVNHAYILNGEAGMGKKTLANAFALSLFCQGTEKRPCLACHPCKQILSGNHPDLIYVTHEKPNSIGVDDIRSQVQDTISIRPYSSDYKVYIIDEAQKMTGQAQNALLKTIEEPPSYAIIVLLTTNQEAFLPTILSRCVQLKLKPLKDETIKQYLMTQFGVSEVDAEVFTAFARGNLGMAIRMVTSDDFKFMEHEMLQLLKTVKQMDISELLEYIQKIKESKLDVKVCLDFMQVWYRDVLLYKVTQDVNLLVFKEQRAAIHEISSRSGYNGLEKILESIDKAKVRLDANVNMELAMELLLLVMKEN